MEHKFPLCINFRKQRNLERRAELFVTQFEAGVFPVLFKFGAFDKEHIVKYMSCTTFQAIYDDFLTERPDRMAYLEQEYRFSGIDHWAMFRDTPKSEQNCPQKKGIVPPEDPAFVFADLPLSDFSQREQLLGCISYSYEKKHLVINYDEVEKLCIIHPTERQLAMFEILSELCDRLKKEGFSREDISSLLYFDAKSRGMRISLPGLLKNNWITLKK